MRLGLHLPDRKRAVLGLPGAQPLEKQGLSPILRTANGGFVARSFEAPRRRFAGLTTPHMEMQCGGKQGRRCTRRPREIEVAAPTVRACMR